MREKIAVTWSVIRVQTQKKIPLELAILPPTSPFPIMWMTGTPDPRIDPRRIIMYPDLLPASMVVPYSQTTIMRTPLTFLTPPGSNPRRMSSLRWNVMKRIESRDVMVNITLRFIIVLLMRCLSRQRSEHCHCLKPASLGMHLCNGLGSARKSLPLTAEAPE